MASEVVRDKYDAIRVRDLFVIVPLQLDELKFFDVMSLLKDEELPGRRWFHAGVDRKEIAFSLKRMVEAGLVACYADGEVGASPVPLPPLPSMEKYWFGLTALGRQWFQYPFPWDYPLEKWGSVSDSSLMNSLVQSIRSDPSAWTIRHISGGPSQANHLPNCRSYKSELRNISTNARVLTHVIELAGSGDGELLHGHFLPPYKSPIEANWLNVSSPLGNEQLVLDALSDDVECGKTILSLLNHEFTTYRKIRGGVAFSKEEVVQSLTRLTSAGLVIPLKEDGGCLVVERFSESYYSLEDSWFLRSPG